MCFFHFHKYVIIESKPQSYILIDWNVNGYKISEECIICNKKRIKYTIKCKNDEQILVPKILY